MRDRLVEALGNHHPRIRSHRLARAGVAIVFHADQVLLVRRAERPSDPWSGDVSFPGGLADAGETGLQAAVRETAEEVALELGDPVGRLSGRVAWHPRARLFAIEPWVFHLEERPALELDPREIAEAVWCSWEDLARPLRLRWLKMRWIPIPAYVRDCGPHTVWGLTGAILDELVAALS